MYDWNGLWDAHAEARTRIEGCGQDAAALAEVLGARLAGQTRGQPPLSVYEDASRYLLAGCDPDLQVLAVDRSALRDITLRFVSEDEGLDLALPYVEILVEDLVTGETDAWRGEVRRDEEGRTWIDRRVLGEGVLPAMPFDGLSFSDHAAFRDELYRLWQEDVPALAVLIDQWFDGGETVDGARVAPEDARLQEICDRYAEIVRHEQAMLSRRFSDEELQLVAMVLRDIRFDSAQSCRGLWLAVEARMLQDEIDIKLGVDGPALLDRLKTLGYAQEVALIEALSPLGDAD